MSMNPLANRLVAKLNGIGNEIAVLDLRGTGLSVSAEEARAIHSGKGLGYDQLIVLHEPHSAGADAFMTIFNSDGSQSGACGNGTRCVAFLLMKEVGRETLVLETAAARLACTRVEGNMFTVDMGRPRLAWNEIPLRDPFSDTSKIDLRIGPADAPIVHSPSAVNMGNPHAIFWVDDTEAYDLSKVGPVLENHPLFPERANISLARVLSPQHIRLKVWERGVGLTRACGSAACAALVAASRRGFTGRHATVSQPGGDLDIRWRESDGHVLMTGPVEFEFETRLDPNLFKDIAA